MPEEKLLQGIKDAAREAGAIMLHASRPESAAISKEGHANYVTVYDRKVQEFLIGSFAALLPEAHFVGEEEDKELFAPGYEEGYTFVIDPIDGTTNFMKDYRVSVTSIALFKDGTPFIGVVYNPYTDQMFWAQQGEGAYENDRRIHSGEESLSQSLVGMGTAPYYDEEMTWKAFQIGHWYLRHSMDVRRTGSAAYDLCLVASGKTGMFFEPCLSLWDYAAGAVIVTEAGGRMTDLKGQELNYRGRSSICAASRGVAQGEYLPPRELQL